MKKIKEFNKLTEEEILNLTKEELSLIIKREKAQKGIKLLPKPILPKYEDILERDVVVAQCDLFSNNIVFDDVNVLNKILKIIEDNKNNIHSIDSDYKLQNGNIKYLSDIKYCSYNTSNTIYLKKVYSQKLYNKLKDILLSNSNLLTEYKKAEAAYLDTISNSKYIMLDIITKHNDIIDKYDKLNNYCKIFKNDYLVIANNNKSMAMEFLYKAYKLTQEEQNYILSNYKK